MREASPLRILGKAWGGLLIRRRSGKVAEGDEDGLKEVGSGLQADIESVEMISGG